MARPGRRPGRRLARRLDRLAIRRTRSRQLAGSGRRLAPLSHHRHRHADNDANHRRRNERDDQPLEPVCPRLMGTAPPRIVSVARLLNVDAGIVHKLPALNHHILHAHAQAKFAAVAGVDPGRVGVILVRVAPLARVRAVGQRQLAAGVAARRLIEKLAARGRRYLGLRVRASNGVCLPELVLFEMRVRVRPPELVLQVVELEFREPAGANGHVVGRDQRGGRREAARGLRESGVAGLLILGVEVAPKAGRASLELSLVGRVPAAAGRVG